MKKYFFLILSTFSISLSAQNIIIDGKFSKPFNENYEKAYTFEVLIATNDNAYSIGVLFGSAKLDFNKYDWAATYEDTYTKSIRGIITYIYPLNGINIDFVRQLYLSLAWEQISDYGIIPGGGYMFSGTGYAYPGSKNESIWIISCGYKIPFKSVNVLLGFGYQHREYDLEFDEYGGTYGFSLERHSIHQIENSVQIDIALQYQF